MSIFLRKRKNADGTTSLRLDIYHNGKRTIETLKNLQLGKVSNVSDRETNKELLQKAEAIRLIRTVELEGNNYNMESDAGKKTMVAVWMQAYIDEYEKKDKRNMQGVLKRFSVFLIKKNKKDLTFGELTPFIIEDFIDYLQVNSKGEGAKSYYARFKKMIKHAYRKKFMKENVLDFVERKVKGKAKKKDILTLEELKVLSATPIDSSEVKRGFLFTCVSGLAWIDLKKLTWDKVNLQTKMLEIVRSKQEYDNNVVSIPLNDTAVLLLGKAGQKKELIFSLPSANGANKTLKAWVKRAGLDKAITWHNGRHSYGTNLILNDVDVTTASKLLGHQNLIQTNRYVDTAGDIKRRGTDKINIEM
jgi:integrase/recombinase XerD